MWYAGCRKAELEIIKGRGNSKTGLEERERMRKILMGRSLLYRIFLFAVVNAAILLMMVFFFISQYTDSYNQTIQNQIENALGKVDRDIRGAYEDIQERGQRLISAGETTYAGLKGYILGDWPGYVDSDENWSSGKIIQFITVYRNLQMSLAQTVASGTSISYYVVFCKDDEGRNIPLLSNMVSLPSQEITELLDGYSVLYEKGFYEFQLPHVSPFSGGEVLSAICTLNLREGLYLYLETSEEWLTSVYHTLDNEWAIYPTFTDAQNRVLYSKAGENLAGNAMGQMGDLGYRYFETDQGNREWSIYALISDREYQRLFGNWWTGFAGISLLSTIAFLALNTLLYLLIYRKINILQRIIRETAPIPQIVPARAIGIRELDGILEAFYDARNCNIRLLQQISEQKQAEKELKYEKLQQQINPHFIQNSLNSIQWMAKLNHQKEIHSMATSLIKVFNYNLSEERLSTLREEFEAIRAYMELQIMRYGNRIQVSYGLHEKDYELLIPRFLLQPLLENAILYGMDEDGNTRITVKAESVSKDIYIVSIGDSGPGFPEEVRRQLLEGEQKRDSGMGIGLRYVLGILSHYHGKVLAVEHDEAGATLRLQLSGHIDEESGREDDQNGNCG